MSIFSDFDNIIIHFSYCLNIKIYDEDNSFLGKTSDFIVDYEEIYPLVWSIQYKKNKKIFYVRWQDILEFNYKKIKVKNNSNVSRNMVFPEINEKKIIVGSLANQFSEEREYPPLGKIVLDRQVVDTSGKKVVRVNDIQLIKIGKNLRVTHAEVGLRSMMRRLGYDKIISILLKCINLESEYLKKESKINWKYVHAIPNRNMHGHVKLNLGNDDIQELHPADLAAILEGLDSFAREVIFSELDIKTKAETLSEVDEDIQPLIIKNETVEDTAKILNEMDVNDAVDILHDFDNEKASKIIEKISDSEHAEEIQELMIYEDDTAGGLMSMEYFTAFPLDTKDQILKKIKEEQDETQITDDIYVIDGNKKILGIINLFDLLKEEGKAIARKIMDSKDIKTLTTDEKWKDVAIYMSKYNLNSVPIVNEESILLGVISVKDVLSMTLK